MILASCYEEFLKDGKFHALDIRKGHKLAHNSKSGVESFKPGAKLSAALSL